MEELTKKMPKAQLGRKLAKRKTSKTHKRGNVLDQGLLLRLLDFSCFCPLLFGPIPIPLFPFFKKVFFLKDEKIKYFLTCYSRNLNLY